MSQTFITFLSDLGTRDASVTVAKAVLMGYVPDAVIIDISHNVKQYDLRQAAYLLLSAYRHFPAGTIHITAVDVFLGDPVRLILAEKDGYYFIAPDNGLLSLAFGDDTENTLLCDEFSKPYTFHTWLNSAGKVIKTLNSEHNALPFPPYEPEQAPRPLHPKLTKDGMECNILYIDRYENIVLDITRPEFEAIVSDKPFRIMLRKVQDITAISNNYNDVPEGDALCRFNDTGYMEIALNRDKAASLLGLGAGSAGIRYPSIRIFF